jgi:acyl-CoA thioesterase
MTTFTPLADLLRNRRREGDTVRFDIPDDWAQGRTTFGGLTSTLGVQAMRDVSGGAWGPEVHLRALQTSFIGPVALGEIDVKVQTLREGKNVRQVQALVQQNGQTAALLLGVFGSDRETTLAPIEPTRPTAPGPEQSMVPPAMPGVAPSFLQHIDSRWSEGAVPFTGSKLTYSRIHARLKGETGAPIDPELLVVLLADVPPTPLLGQFTTRTPASSVSWELELRPLREVPAADGFWRIDTDALAAAGGYVNQISKLWAPSGQLAALGYQVVTVYG